MAAILFPLTVKEIIISSVGLKYSLMSYRIHFLILNIFCPIDALTASHLILLCVYRRDPN